MENHKIVPDHIDPESFELKLADLQNKHDPLIDPIDYEEDVACYNECNLCLVRKDSSSPRLAIYQEKLPESDIFEVDVHIDTPRIHMNCFIKLPFGSCFSDLKSRVIATCALQ